MELDVVSPSEEIITRLESKSGDERPQTSDDDVEFGAVVVGDDGSLITAMSSLVFWVVSSGFSNLAPILISKKGNYYYKEDYSRRDWQN